jgi:glycine betaine catabolism B
MKARLDHIVHENKAKTIKSFWFEPDKALDHIAGQFIEMTLKHDNPDDKGIKRWFTISSSPTDAPLFSITTKFSEPSSTFKSALNKLQIGDSVNIEGPIGDFVLPIDAQIPLTFVAGGIGITPFHSILKWLYDTKQSRDITLIYAARTEAELVFLKLFEKYGMTRDILLSEPEASWTGSRGQLSGELIIKLAKPVNDSIIFVSGPEKMVESLEDQLTKLGIDKSRQVGDFFPGYTKL